LEAREAGVDDADLINGTGPIARQLALSFAFSFTFAFAFSFTFAFTLALRPGLLGATTGDAKRCGIQAFVVVSTRSTSEAGLLNGQETPAGDEGQEQERAMPTQTLAGSREAVEATNCVRRECRKRPKAAARPYWAMRLATSTRWLRLLSLK
jgi:hypothetical protein